MTFTDEDLKEWRAFVVRNPAMLLAIQHDLIVAALDRLEAAETYVDAHREGRPPVALAELYAQWRKAAGK